MATKQKAEGGEAVAEMIDAGDGMNTPKVRFLSAGYRPPIGTKLYLHPSPRPTGELS